MAGSKAGGLKAASTNRRKHGEDFYVRIGQKGGQMSRNGGFAYVDDQGNPVGKQRAREYGAIGGRISRRGNKGGWE